MALEKDVTGGWLFSDLSLRAILLETSFKRYQYYVGYSITPYGSSNATEFFAEVFAHLQCSKNPNGLGLAMRDLLAEIQEDLK